MSVSVRAVSQGLSVIWHNIFRHFMLGEYQGYSDRCETPVFLLSRCFMDY